MFEWYPEKGYGFYPVDPESYPYDQRYFDKYLKYSCTSLGVRLTDYRVRLVKEWCPGTPLLDIGIGCGQFVQAIGCRGTDINPAAKEWLSQRNAYVEWKDLSDYGIFTCWDSFEHLDVEQMQDLQLAAEWIVMSIPIFRSMDHCLQSRHFRPTEHYWYFTHGGIQNFMEGWEMKYFSKVETLLGREDIYSYVWRKK